MFVVKKQNPVRGRKKIKGNRAHTFEAVVYSLDGSSLLHCHLTERKGEEVVLLLLFFEGPNSALTARLGYHEQPSQGLGPTFQFLLAQGRGESGSALSQERMRFDFFITIFFIQSKEIYNAMNVRSSTSLKLI